MREFEVKFMTVNLDDRLKEVNESIRKNNEEIASNKAEITSEMRKGFKQVNKRINNLIKGTEDEGKV